ncbi:MAG: TM0106 family RecB-like putative nuclease, partial [Candidatus Nanopelagicales bacterium]
NEVFFDIEADPMRDLVYLHGFVERPFAQAAESKFKPFYSAGITPAEEEFSFAQAWQYLNTKIVDSIIYYYSAYERTAYKKLALKYPGVCSKEDVEAFFELPAMIDLYTQIVKKYTEWPTYNQSIKTLAQYLGFQWRDSHPSGAASIEWYNTWVTTQDPKVKQRILDYNEDDCLATGVVLDGIRAF